MNALAVKSIATRTLGSASLFLKANGPHIMVGVGTVGTVISAVLACKATLKLEEIKAETKEAYDQLEDGRKRYDLETYPEESYKQDVIVVSVQGAIKIVKLYLPSALLMAASLGLIIGGHYVLAKRTAAAVAAYKTLDAAFRRYKDMIQEELGEESEKEIELKALKKAIKEVNDSEEGEHEYIYGACPSPYGRWFDKNCSSWRGDPVLNRFYLTAQQNYMNELLHGKGHLVLNTVYDALGYEETDYGAIVGWLSKGDGADGFVDFGFLLNNDDDWEKWIADNGRDAPILLDFNVDGVIYNYISKKGEK